MTTTETRKEKLVAERDAHIEAGRLESAQLDVWIDKDKKK